LLSKLVPENVQTWIGGELKEVLKGIASASPEAIGPRAPSPRAECLRAYANKPRKHSDSSERKNAMSVLRSLRQKPTYDQRKRSPTTDGHIRAAPGIVRVCTAYWRTRGDIHAAP
jgi:hypothetical protein